MMLNGATIASLSGVTFAGLIADSRTLVERAQIEAQNFWFTYNRKIRVEDVTMSVANLALQFGDDDAKVYLFYIYFWCQPS